MLSDAWQNNIDEVLNRMAAEFVQLLNSDYETIGTMEKLLAHKQGALHRAVSVFIFNHKGEMLLQQRAADKYHSPLLWSNACCTHPRLNEAPLAAAQRRLKEEMGLQCLLEYKFDFQYRAELDKGLIEHEFDHIYIGHTDNDPQPDSKEVAAWQYLSIPDIKDRLLKQPEEFTIWFHLLFHKLSEINSSALFMQ